MTKSISVTHFGQDIEGGVLNSMNGLSIREWIKKVAEDLVSFDPNIDIRSSLRARLTGMSIETLEKLAYTTKDLQSEEEYENRIGLNYFKSDLEYIFTGKLVKKHVSEFMDLEGEDKLYERVEEVVGSKITTIGIFDSRSDSISRHLTSDTIQELISSNNKITEII